MIGLVIVTHGALATEFLAAMEHVVGPQRAVATVADYLGMSIDPAAAVEVPRIERQAQGGRKKWLAALGGGGD